MILTKKKKITITNNNKKYYKNLGYNIPNKRNPIVEINIEDLQLNSNLKIECKCDICGKIKYISYYHYNKNIKNKGFYSCKGKCSRLKYIETCKDKYNVENTFQDENIKNKCKKTLIKKYGVDNINKLEKTKKAHKKRNKKNFNVEHYFNSKDFKIKSDKTIKEKFGDIDNVFQSEIIKKKSKKTLIKKYGVEYPSQNVKIHNKQQISGFKLKKHEIGIYYRGSYEKNFLDYCLLKNIKIEKGPRIKYKFKNNEHYYFSDYFHKSSNTIIEIKSDYYYKKELHKNLMKRKFSLKNGYDFLFIINKRYENFDKIL